MTDVPPKKKKFVPKGRPFKPGQSGNPKGRPPVPEDIRIAAKMGVINFMSICNRLGVMNLVELNNVVSKEAMIDGVKKRVTNDESNVMEVIVASILLKVAKEADVHRLQFFLGQIGQLAPTKLALTTPDGKDSAPMFAPTVVIRLPENGSEAKPEEPLE